MTSVQFKAWVGPKYEIGGINGRKVLVLGESHYGDEGDEYEEFTAEVVEKWAINERLAFFTKIAKSVLLMPKEKYLSDDCKADFWESVAFYNYVQKFAGDGPRQRPAEDLWKISEQVFFETINSIKPEICVVFGYELWGNLPKPHKEIENGDGSTTYVYRLSNGQAMIAGCVAHPSGGLSYAEAHSRIDALFKQKVD